PQGRAALAANHQITYAVQSDTNAQPLLLPFPQAQARALSDAFITSDNASGLSDGLGSGFGAAYRTLLDYKSTDGGRTWKSTGALPTVQVLFSAAFGEAGADSTASKYFLANGGVATPAGCQSIDIDGAGDILNKPGAETDVYGKAYGLPGVTNPSPGANPCGNSRPFQTDYRIAMYRASDFWGVPSANALYLDGPAADLRTNPSFPSGHTTYGYVEGVLLGILLPQRYPQMVTRAAEYGNGRILLGAHYTMDVIAGRTLALYVLAHLLANDRHFRATKAARAELQSALDGACRLPAAACSGDTGRFADAAKNEAFYESTQTYGLPVVYAATASEREDVFARAPEAGYLLMAAFPKIATLAQADNILTATEGPGGGFLNDGGEFGVYSRIDLYKAAVAAAAVFSR
ncbi:MAG TPA: phosphatase PAP2 family protein, partial [Candidatus Acidoferrales bacterium]|nr:phosphatase PAP2 family protein [Candidatus Acidoferrales bacterium]